MLVLVGSRFAGTRAYDLSYRNSAGSLYVAGNQDVDLDWIQSIKSQCLDHCPLIVPRYVWEAEKFEWGVSDIEIVKARTFLL